MGKTRRILITHPNYGLLNFSRIWMFIWVCLQIGLVSAFSQTHYTLTDLGTFGGDHSIAYGINNSGVVVGVSRAVPDEPSTIAADFPFVYSNGVMTAICTCFGWATAINAAGQITGFASFPTGQHAFLYENGILKDLGALPGSMSGPHYSLAYGMNSAGVVVGQTRNEAMVYYQGIMATLGRRAALTAHGINDSNDIVGTLQSEHAFLFHNNRLVDLGTLDGDKNGTSEAFAINSSGQVVGYSYIAGNSIQRPFLYQNGVMTDLGALSGAFGAAWGINKAGDIVGEFDGSAFIYRNGVMMDLNDLVQVEPGSKLFHLFTAFSINDLGQIVGRGAFENEYGDRAFLLTPIP